MRPAQGQGPRADQFVPDPPPFTGRDPTPTRFG